MVWDRNNHHDWLIIKQSNIPDAGFGLFVAISFQKYDLIGQFMEKTYCLSKKKTL